MLSLPSLARIAFCLGALTATACRTADGRDEAAPPAAVAAPAPNAAATKTGFGSSLALAPDDAQNVYLKLLTVETTSGVQVPKEQLHTSRALLTCRQGAQVACSVRIRLAAGELSPSQPLPPPVAAKFWAFVVAARPDVGQENEGVADLTCDYLGKKSPPYDVESLNCAVTQPRFLTEAVFDASLSEELSEDLRGEAPFGKGATTLTGVLSCQWPQDTPRAPCVARAYGNGVLQEKLTMLSASGAAQASRLLRRAVSDHTLVTAPIGPAPTKPAGDQSSPQEIAAALVCVVEISKSDPENKPTFVCRAKI